MWELRYQNCGHKMTDRFNNYVDMRKFAIDWCSSRFQITTPNGIVWNFYIDNSEKWWRELT